MKVELLKEIELGSQVQVDFDAPLLKVKGPKGECQRRFAFPKVEINAGDGKITIKSSKATKREKAIVGSFEAHIKNMVTGVQEPFVYKLKICSGHFPMNVAVSGNEVVIKNFLGESVPRRVSFQEAAKVKVQGDEILVTSCDKEIAGQTAGKIESLCRITKRDSRIFQDGCYITKKP